MGRGRRFCGGQTSLPTATRPRTCTILPVIGGSLRIVLCCDHRFQRPKTADTMSTYAITASHSLRVTRRHCFRRHHLAFAPYFMAGRLPPPWPCCHPPAQDRPQAPRDLPGHRFHPATELDASDFQTVQTKWTRRPALAATPGTESSHLRASHPGTGGFGAGQGRRDRSVLVSLDSCFRGGFREAAASRKRTEAGRGVGVGCSGR